MLIFHCTDCNKEIDCLDHESPDQAFTNLDEHIAKCPVATFTIEATTEWAKDIAEVIQSAMHHAHLKGKYRLHKCQSKTAALELLSFESPPLHGQRTLRCARGGR